MMDSYILADTERVLDADDAFFAMTGYTKNEVLGLRVEDAFVKLLKLHPSDYTRLRTENAVSGYLFTKDCVAKYASLTIKPLANRRMAIEFRHAPYVLQNNEFAFIEQFFADDHISAAIYSVPGYRLLKANKSYLKYFDASRRGFRRYAGRAAGELGVYGGQAEALLDQVRSARKVLNFEEKEISTVYGRAFLNYTIIPVIIDGTLKYIFETSKDVTDSVLLRKSREAQEGEIRKQKEKLEAILDNMSDQLIVVSRDGFYELFNKAAREKFDPIYGPTEKLWDAKTDVRYYDMNNNRIFRGDLPISRVLEGERFSRFRFKIRHRETTVLEVNAAPIRDDEGEVVSGVLCCRDITEHMELEQELRESELHLRMAAQAAALGTFTYDLITKEGRWSPTFKRIFGIDKIDGSKIDFEFLLTLTHPDDRQKLLPAMKKAGDPRHGLIDLESRIILPDKSVRWIRLKGQTYFSEESMPRLAAGVIIDMTDEVEAAENLRKITQELQNIIDNTDDLIFSVDSAYKIVLFNKAAENYFLANYGEGFWRGKRLCDISHAELRQRLSEMCVRAMEHGKYQIDLRALSCDHVICFTLNPVYLHGEAVEVSVYGKDITERNRTEHEIVRKNTTLELLVQERTRELQNSMKDLQDISMAVSHEMKTPLREIEYYAKQILEHRDVELNSQKMIRLCHDKLNMIDKLFRYSVTTGANVNKETFNIKKMIQAVHEELRSNMHLKRAVLDFETGLPPVSADKALMRQVLSNIISNALKFSSKREAPQLSVGCREENGEYVFYFRDNGAGFCGEYADKLFSVFERLHTEEEFEGSGIGLAIVKNIIKRHGGRTWIKGEEDIGATMYFTLPVPDRG